MFGIFLVGVLTFYAGNQRVHALGQSQVETQQTGRVMLERMQRELRIAGYDPQDVIPLQTVNAAIQAADATTVTFISDLNADGTTDQATYTLQGTRIVREMSSWNGSAFPTASGGVLGQGVSAFGFTYYDGSDTALAVPVSNAQLDDIRRIEIGLTTSHRTAGGEQQDHSLTVDVRLRNVR